MSGIRYFSEVLNQKGAPALYEDLIDNRPAATFEGRLFFATDVTSGDTIFRDNGDGTWSALAGNAGGGGTFINGVTTLTGGVGLGGSLDQDTEILLNGLSFKLTNNGNNLLLDTVNDLYYFGKGNALDAGLGIQIVADAFTNYIGTTYGNLGDIGLGLDFLNRIYQIGDFALILNGTTFQINEDTQVIKTKNLNNDVGLKLDFDNKLYQFGDFDNVNFNTSLFIDDDNLIIYTKSQGSEKGIALELGNNVYKFGDYNGLSGSAFINIYDVDRTIELRAGNNNNTYILLEDNDAKISFVTQVGNYNFANVPDYAGNAAAILAGLSVGQIYRVTGSGNMHIVF